MDSKKLSCFPLFIPMDDKSAVVVGGGKIAERRIATLMKFTCRIHVISPDVTSQIAEWIRYGQITHEAANYDPAALIRADIVVAATNDRLVNHQVGQDAKNAHKLVSVCDRQEECNFFFPAIIEHDPFVIGLSSQGQSPSALAEFARKLRGILARDFKPSDF